MTRDFQSRTVTQIRLAQILSVAFALSLATGPSACSGGGGGDGGGGSGGRTSSTGVRIIHSSLDEAPLTVSIDGVPVQTASYLETVDFSPVEEGARPVWLDRANSTSERIFVTTQPFEKETEYTLFVWGEARTDERRVSIVPEAIQRPEKGQALVRFAQGYDGGGRFALRCGSTSSEFVRHGSVTEYLPIAVGPQNCDVVSEDGGRVSSLTFEPADRSDATVVLSGSEEIGFRVVRVYADLD